MRIYLDDDLDSNLLICLLVKDLHEVFSPRETGTRGTDDESHLRFAASKGLVLLTANASDYVTLHGHWVDGGKHHRGMLIVYRENDPTRDMTLREIAEAIAALDASGLPLEDTCQNLNFWRRKKSK